jgi:hypothetical protein
VFAALCTAASVYAYIRPRPRQQPQPEGEAQDQLQDPLLPAAGATTNEHSSGTGGQESLQHILCIVVLVALAGMVAGIVGIGGGLLMGPMLLDLGVHPQVTRGYSFPHCLLLRGRAQLQLHV